MGALVTPLLIGLSPVRCVRGTTTGTHSGTALDEGAANRGDTVLNLIVSLAVGVIVAVIVATVLLVPRRRIKNLLTPGIRAEVSLIMGESGQIGIYLSKLSPEENPSEIHQAFVMRYLAMLSGLGVTLDFQTASGQVIPLVRPSAEAAREAGGSHEAGALLGYEGVEPDPARPGHVREISTPSAGPMRYCRSAFCNTQRHTIYDGGALHCGACGRMIEG